MVRSTKYALVLVVYLSVLVLGAFGTSERASAQPQAGGTDVALVIDGSSSISASDFALQKEGIKEALEDALILPRNGSVALTIIQYAETSTETHVPYTVINSEADVASVTSQVDSIRQLGGDTNPGDGIKSGSSVLNTSGNASSKQTICLSTDGLPNSGADVPTELSRAKTSPIGLDRFTVIAIEDPPQYYAADFEAYYDPLVFGGGAVTVVEDSVEFANSIGGCLTGRDLELVGIEVNQAVQDWNNSVILIENKTTYVRAHIQTTQQGTTRAFARLHGTRGGAPLPGSPLTAINPSASAVIGQDAPSVRGELDKSLNFRLPLSWLNGSIEVEVEATGSELECKEAARTDNDCKVDVSFSKTDPLEVEFVGLTWTDTDGKRYTPSLADMFELAARLRAIFPINNLDWQWSYTEWTGAKPEDEEDYLDIADFLDAYRRQDGPCFSTSGCNRLYYGILVGPVEPMGLARKISGDVASGQLPSYAYARGTHRHAHEIGHLLGRHHAVHPPVIDPDPDELGDEYKLGWCREDADDIAPDFPFSADIVLVRDSVTETLATIGPMDAGQNSLVYGLDTHLMNSAVPTARRQAVLEPNEYPELMSYCNSWTLGPRWISTFTYTRVRDGINARFTLGTYGKSAQAAAVAPYMFVRGRVNFADETVNLLPLSTLESPVLPPVPPPGEYNLTLQVLDASSGVLQEIVFGPDRSSEFGTHLGSFTVPVLMSPAIKQVRVLHDGKVLASVSASANAPTVAITYPNGGESLSGTQTTLRWTASDADSDPLTFDVQYSPDDGSTWQALVVDWPEKSYEVALSSLEGTSSGLIRVIASDGFNTTTDQSDGTFSVPNNEPQVIIFSPGDNELFLGAQRVYLSGEAIDREDHLITGVNLQWRSNLNGYLGSGRELDLRATDLAEGEHVISLTATDAAGASISASVTIQVYRLEAPPSSTVYLPVVLRNYAGPNQPPYTPSSPSPANGATNQGVNVKLSWSGGDPDGNAVTYDVRLGTTSPPAQLVCAGNPSPICDPGNLSPKTRYYWQVTARDPFDLVSTGPVWTFATGSPAPERIAFASERDGNREIYVMNPDGSGQTRLTHNNAFDSDPAWSPDGTRIAFASQRDGNYEIYVMNADGSGQVRLTNHPAEDNDPAWAGSNRILFESERTGNMEIFAMNADGSGLTNLTNHPAKDSQPDWSSTGRIAFTSMRDGRSEIYAMNADGSGQTNLTNHPGGDFDADWSPDGQRLAFNSKRDGNREVYVMNANGSGQTRLTNREGHDYQPSWSPDGARLAFTSERTGNLEIHTMNANGSGVTRLTNRSQEDSSPSWSR